MSLLQSIEDLETRIDEALAVDPAGLPGSVLAEAERAMARVRNKVAAVDARLAGAFDASKEWMGNGSRSAAAWLVSAGREPKTVAERRVAQGRVLRSMPLVWAAFARGDINADHVDRLVSARAGREDAFAADEALLVRWAVEKRFVAFREGPVLVRPGRPRRTRRRPVVAQRVAGLEIVPGRDLRERPSRRGGRVDLPP